MLGMIIKMSAVTGVQVLLVILLWLKFRDRTMKIWQKILIGLVFGTTAVLSTHFGVDYNMMLINARDLGPLSAGLFFDPVSGIIAGLIGGIERFIAGTYWGVGSYTCLACSISTCLAGILSAVLRVFLFKGKRPSVVYSLFMGAVMEVFHMYSVFLTHRDDIATAFYVVRTCSAPMIIFNAAGLALCALIIGIINGDFKNFFHFRQSRVQISSKFQLGLFIVTFVVIAVNYQFTYSLQTAAAVQYAHETLERAQSNIGISSELLGVTKKSIYEYSNQIGALSMYQVGREGTFDLINDVGFIPVGDHRLGILSKEEREILKEHDDGEFFEAALFSTPSLCLKKHIDNDITLLTMLPLTEVYAQRDEQGYESVFAGILLFATIFVFVSIIVEKLVVSGIIQVNQSLDRISSGKLDEEVNVRNSVEFSSLSDDINQMVASLKGYIEAEKKRMASELELARNIQKSSLPSSFSTMHEECPIYALMDPAREVGGDFYDFFYINHNQLVLVIADVSGKGIPAALFMMRSKTAIRALAASGSSPSEILFKANNELCEGNDAEMFITVWIGILNTDTGVMICANAGHEYPVFMPAGGEFSLVKDRHGLVLAAMENSRFRDYELQFHPGDRLFVYTDGVPEAVNEADDQYGTERLVAALNKWRDLPIQEVAPAVRRDIEEFAGEAEQFDDITMLELIYSKKSE